MYQEYFGLKKYPFENTADPYFFFMGHNLRDILALLVHSVLSRKGLTVLSGPVGTGKTMLSTVLLQCLPGESLVIKVPHPKLSPRDFLHYIASNLEIGSAFNANAEIMDRIKIRLENILDEQRYCILLIDEAQFLSYELFQEILFLSDLQSNGQKLLHIFLMGQEELISLIQKPELKQIHQRISVLKTLSPFSGPNTFRYIIHRLKKGGGNETLFSKEAIELVYRISGGNPRLVNKICDAALLGAYVNQKKQVDADDVYQANKDIGMDTEADDDHIGFLKRLKEKKELQLRRTEEIKHKTEAQPSPAKENEIKNGLPNGNNTGNPQGVNRENKSEAKNNIKTNIKKKPSFQKNNLKKSFKPDPFKKSFQFELKHILLVLAAIMFIGIFGFFLFQDDIMHLWKSKKPHSVAGNSASVVTPDKIKHKITEEINDANINETSKAMAGNPAQKTIPMQQETKSEVVMNIPDEENEPQKENPPSKVTNSSAEKKTTQISEKAESPVVIVKTENMHQNSGRLLILGEAGPFVIYYGSYETREKAESTIKAIEISGVSPFFTQIDLGDKGTWYRIFSGFYKTESAAKLVIDRLDLKNAYPKQIKYAVSIGIYKEKANLISARNLLVNTETDPFVITDKDSVFTLYAGVFYRKERAEKLCGDLSKLNIPCKTVKW